jgi:hypothetical protein
LLSLLTPVGVGRQAELHPGIAVNVAYLGAGLVAAFLFVVLFSVIPVVWTSSPARRSRRSTTRVTAGARIGGALATAGASTAAEAGVRMALEPGRGRSSVPVRSTIVSAIVGVAVIAGVIGFSASLGTCCTSRGCTAELGHPDRRHSARPPPGSGWQPARDRRRSRQRRSCDCTAVRCFSTRWPSIR